MARRAAFVSIAIACSGPSSVPDASVPDASDEAGDVANETAFADAADGGATVKLTVDVVLNAPATGTVTPTPVGASCGSGCYAYAPGTSVTLTAAAGASNAFSGWGGACSGDAPACALSVAADTAVNAVFSPFNVMFVTSNAYAPKDYGGLAGADAICKAAATSAGLHPGKWMAMLSASGGDAGPDIDFVTRVPSGVRGWVRADGKPFADTLTGLFGAPHRMFYPPRVDEKGAEIPSSLPYPYVITATNESGRYDHNGDCGQFVQPVLNDESTPGGGWAYSAYPLFTVGEMFGCASAERLYCFETDWYAPLVPSVPSGARVAFVTQGSWFGGEGVAGFDQHCADEAADAGLAGQFAAFVQTPDASAPSRLSADGGTWTRRDGTLLAPSAAALLTLATPLAALQQRADGTYDARYIGGVWTGIGATSCSGWTTTDAGTGATGVANDTTNAFGGAYPPACGTLQPVYCFEK